MSERLGNAWPVYLENGESSPGDQGDKHLEVTQDISTNWFVLLAIFFPSVTGIMTGANMSGTFLKDGVGTPRTYPYYPLQET